MPYAVPDMTDPVVIGVDGSTKTGIAVCKAREGKVEVLHTAKLHYPKLKGLDRLLAIQEGFELICINFRPTFAIIEGYGFRNKFTLVTLTEVGTTLRLSLVRQGIPTATLAPKSVKKWATGDGNSDKKAMVKAAAERWGIVTKDDDIADALALSIAGLGWCSAIAINCVERQVLRLLTLITSANSSCTAMVTKEG